jgi:hypothetical protein
MALEPAPESRYSVRSSGRRSLARLDHSGGASSDTMISRIAWQRSRPRRPLRPCQRASFPDAIGSTRTMPCAKSIATARQGRAPSTKLRSSSFSCCANVTSIEPISVTPQSTLRICGAENTA